MNPTDNFFDNNYNSFGDFAVNYQNLALPFPSNDPYFELQQQQQQAYSMTPSPPNLNNFVFNQDSMFNNYDGLNAHQTQMFPNVNQVDRALNYGLNDEFANFSVLPVQSNMNEVEQNNTMTYLPQLYSPLQPQLIVNTNCDQDLIQYGTPGQASSYNSANKAVYRVQRSHSYPNGEYFKIPTNYNATICSTNINVHNCPQVLEVHRKHRGRQAKFTSDLPPKKLGKFYECGKQGCKQIFKRNEHLKRHVKSVHDRIQNFVCPECEKKFSRSDNLKQHQKVHEPNRKTKVHTIRDQREHINQIFGGI